MVTTTQETPPAADTSAFAEMQAWVKKIETQIKEAVRRSFESLKGEGNKWKSNADEVKKQIENQGEQSKNPIVRVIDNKEDLQKLPQKKTTEIYVKEAIKACQEKPEEMGAHLNSTNRVILENLIQNINDPDTQVTSDSAPYVFDLLYKIVNNKVSSPLEALSREDLRYLSVISPGVHKRVVDTLSSSASKLGVEQKTVDQFKAESAVKFEIDHSKRAEYIPRDRNTGREVYPDPFERFYTDEDKEVVFAMLDHENPQRFITLANKQHQEVIDENNRQGLGLTQEQIDRLASERLKNTITLKFAKLYNLAYSQPTTQDWESIIQAGFMHSMKTAEERLSSSMELLRQSVATLEATAGRRLINFDIYHNESRTTEVEVEKDGKKHNQKFTVPAGNVKKGSLSKFLEVVNILTKAESESTEYLHNVSYILRRASSGEQGFYGSLAGYAQKMTATDVDTLAYLPDNNIFMEAYRLYVKYLEEEMSKNNWIHTPEMFAHMREGRFTEIEEEVSRDLKAQFSQDIGAEDWRIKRAMTFGIGIAKGILITEQEIGSSADPNVDILDKANPSYKSYGTNDNTAYNPLNPMHHFFRWQAEGVTKGPLMYMRVRGFKPSLFDTWDHRKEMGYIDKFRESFTEGRKGFIDEDPETKIFMDLLPNLARVGGLTTRGGWRMKDAYTGWIRYETPNPNQSVDPQKIDFLTSWKAVENIGFEVLLDLVNGKMIEDEKFLAGQRNPQQRDELMKYIYKKYINPRSQNVDADYVQELAQTRAEAEKLIKEKIKKKEIDPPEKAPIGNPNALAIPNPKDPNKILLTEKGLIEKELYEQILFKGLFGVIRERIPTKLLRLDRDRFDKDGRRTWRRVKEAIEPPMTHEKFDQVMKDLLKVESNLRRKTSEEMHRYISQQDPPSLVGFTADNYKVNEVNIRQILGEYYRHINDMTDHEKAQKIEDAVKVYNKMDEMYLNNTTINPITKITKKTYMNEMAEKIRHRNQHFPFAIGTEELDISFLSYRTAGDSVLRRMFADINDVDSNVFKPLVAFADALHHTSIDPKHDTSKIIEHIGKIKGVIDSLHGPPYCYEVAFDLASLAIAYFKKDAVAANLVTKLSRMGTSNSLAAEFAGGAGKVETEWETKDIDNFILDLGKQGIIPVNPYDTRKGPMFVEQERKLLGMSLKPLGKIPVVGKGLSTKLVKRKPDYRENYSAKLRENFHATHGAVAESMITKYLPLLMLFLAWQFIQKALKEAQGEKS